MRVLQNMRAGDAKLVYKFHRPKNENQNFISNFVFQFIKKSEMALQVHGLVCSRQSINLINKVHEKGLRLTYIDETKDFQQILRQQNEITIYQRNLQVLMAEVYKIVNGIAPPIMNSLFQFRCNTNNIRNFQEIFTKNRKTVKYGTETVTYRAPFLWAN